MRELSFSLLGDSLKEFKAALGTWRHLRDRELWVLTGFDEATEAGLPAGRFIVESPTGVQRAVPFGLIDEPSRSEFRASLASLSRLEADDWRAGDATLRGRLAVILLQRADVPEATDSRSARARATPARAARSQAAGEKLVRQRMLERPSAYDLTEAAALDALRSDQGLEAVQLRALLGDRHFEELRRLASEAQRRRSTLRAGERPMKVLVLHGIMGSRLGREKSLFGISYNDVIWLDPVDIRLGRLEQLRLDEQGRSLGGIGAVSVLFTFYLRLKLSLEAAGFDADFYAYDWRRGLRELGLELAAHLKTLKAPACIVAHSMGGLVARAALKHLKGGREHVTRLVMMGTPNHGSFVPAQALRAAYPFLKSIAWLAPGGLEQLTEEVFATFPGLYQLLAQRPLFDRLPLFDSKNWPSSAPRLNPALLQQAEAVPDLLAEADDRFHVIAGVDQETIVGLSLEENEFVYLVSRDGDGTVPLKSALLSGCASTHLVRGSHGILPNLGPVCDLAIDLVADGSTRRPGVEWPGDSNAPRRFREAELRGATPALRGVKRGEEPPPEIMREILAPLMALDEPEQPSPMAPAMPPAPGRPTSVLLSRPHMRRLELALFPGSLTHVSSRAYVLGSFKGVAPAGAAAAVDACMNGVIGDFVQRRMFSGNLGEVFILPKGRSFVAADHVVFVGLGPFDRFSRDRATARDGGEPEAMQLVAESVLRTCLHANIEEFATVLLGASAAENTADALRLLTRSFVRALEAVDLDRRIRRVILCETNPERVEEIANEIVLLGTGEVFEKIELQFTRLPAPRPAEVMRGAAPTRVGGAPTPIYLLARMYEPPNAPRARGRKAVRTGPDTDLATTIIETSILTPESKAAVYVCREAVTQGALQALLQIPARRGFNPADLQALGSGLGSLIFSPAVARKIQEFADTRRRETGEDLSVVVVHDAQASSIPWETIRFGNWIPALTSGVCRHSLEANLSIAKWFEHRRDDPVLDVLLVTNPLKDLEGADEEGDLIRKLLGGVANVRVVERRHDEATWENLRADFGSGQYDVIHYAGHALFVPDHPGRSGLVCSDGRGGSRILSGSDLAGLSGLPPLVFFNACESGRVRGASGLLDSTVASRRRKGTASSRGGSRARLAGEVAASATGQRLTLEMARSRSQDNISIANAFIRGGVANFLGTYWPVGDLAALTFSRTLYPLLVSGKALGDAVLAARKAVAQEGSVDWADYLLYGSLDFRLKRPQPTSR
jgi:hypothetical protein